MAAGEGDTVVGPAPASPSTSSPKEVLADKQPASCSFAAAAQSGACPMPFFNPATGLPSALSNDASASTAASLLSTARQVSSIPMSPLDETAVPKHQPGGVLAQGRANPGAWVYPSEQMFFNAMKRKAWDPNAKGWDPSAEDMTAVVAIHNTVNERAWQEVMVYERMHACDCAEPKLKKFMGRPSDFTPKARLLNFLGFSLPFDRHDWIVDRCGTEVRYVIDFYQGAPQPGVPAAMFLDTRPALDSFGSAWDRISMQCRWMWSGRWRE
eukprot:gene22331-29408_t